MFLAHRGIIPPQEYEHDPELFYQGLNKTD